MQLPLILSRPLLSLLLEDEDLFLRSRLADLMVLGVVVVVADVHPPTTKSFASYAIGLVILLRNAIIALMLLSLLRPALLLVMVLP